MIRSCRFCHFLVCISCNVIKLRTRHDFPISMIQFSYFNFMNYDWYCQEICTGSTLTSSLFPENYTRIMEFILTILPCVICHKGCLIVCKNKFDTIWGYFNEKWLSALPKQLDPSWPTHVYAYLGRFYYSTLAFYFFALFNFREKMIILISNYEFCCGSSEDKADILKKT